MTWINVNERLPLNDVSVAILISDPEADIHHWPTCAYMRVVHRDTKYEETEWWAGVPGNYMRLPDNGWTVTHWCELPKPPAKQAEAP